MAPALNPGMPRKPSPIVFPVLLALALVFGCKDQRYVFAPSGLTLRNAPSAAGQSIGIVPVGSSVEILEESESTATVEGITAPFVRIKFEQTEGWVFSGFLTDGDSGASLAPTLVPPKLFPQRIGRHETNTIR